MRCAVPPISLRVQERNAVADSITIRATTKQHAKLKRRRLCHGCLEKPETKPTLVLGPIYSELPCQGCGKKPCRGAMVEN